MSVLEIGARYRDLMRRISAIAGPKRHVDLLAVSKGQPDGAIESLYRVGHKDFGENYAQELAEKARKLKNRGIRDLKWHFIGHLQTNKVKSIIPFISSVHSVHSEKLARELAKQWKAAKRPGRLPVFLEINIDAEESKSGIDPEDAPALAAKVAALPELELKGLMCIPKTDGDAAGAFRRLKQLEERCRPHTAGGLSMGMSGDFEPAVREGATHVRVGTAIFGEREKR